MAASGAHLFLSSTPSIHRQLSTSIFVSQPTRRSSSSFRSSAVTVQASSATATFNTSIRENGSLQKGKYEAQGSRLDELAKPNGSADVRKSLNDFFEESRDLIRPDSGPPRWFSPLECGSPHPDSPLLLFLPGIDGTGLGLVMHHQRLGKIFNIWCMHIPVQDRTPFSGLVNLVERTIRSENKRSPNSPIYLVGESLGGCIALDVAAQNPNIDLVLILANPATSYRRSQLQLLSPLIEAIPKQLGENLPHSLRLVTGEIRSTMMMDSFLKALPLPQGVEELFTDILASSNNPLVLADLLPKETLQWKLQMLNVASASANSHLHAVKAQTLILCSGSDSLLPSQEEGQRLRGSLPRCEIRSFEGKCHFLFLEGDVDLVTVIKGASFYRRGKFHDCVSDYIPPTYSEFKTLYDSFRWLIDVTSPVMLSTLENGEVVKGLAGIPSEGPVLFVGYHMLLGLEMPHLIAQMFTERNILVRGIAHPMLFTKLKDGKLPDPATYDGARLMGAVPVAGKTFYKLLSSKSHVLLYPGGMREALHRKGEEYKLFWPERSEFVRMAARFGAKIVPFGAVGEDDLGQVVIDYNDLIHIPYFKSEIETLTKEALSLRTDAEGEVANQDIYLPGILPKVPGRFYYYFAKPIETEGRKHELRDREKAHELYLHVKSEVERCMSFLKERRKQDPYRNLLPRLVYQTTHGSAAEVPTFELLKD